MLVKTCRMSGVFRLLKTHPLGAEVKFAVLPNPKPQGNLLLWPQSLEGFRAVFCYSHVFGNLNLWCC